MKDITKIDAGEHSWLLMLEQLRIAMPKRIAKANPELKKMLENDFVTLQPRIIGQCDSGSIDPNCDNDYAEVAINCPKCGHDEIYTHDDENIGYTGEDQNLHSSECGNCGEYVTVDNAMNYYETHGVIYDCGKIANKKEVKKLCTSS